MDGSALPRVKRALVDKLETQGVKNVSYGSPASPDDMLGEDGSGLACWFGDDSDSISTVEVLTGPDNVWLDERRNLSLRIQALGLNTDDTQEAVDQRETEMLGDVMYVLSTNPDLDIDDDTIQTFSVLPLDSTPWTGGLLPSGMRAARYEVGLQIHARLKLGGA